MTKETGPAFEQSKVTRYNCFIAFNKKENDSKNLRHKHLSLLYSAWNKKKEEFEELYLKIWKFEILKFWNFEIWYFGLCKLINNLSSEKKKIMPIAVFGYLISNVINTEFCDFISPFLFTFRFDQEDVSLLKKVFDHISRYLEVRQKYSAARSTICMF